MKVRQVIYRKDGARGVVQVIGVSETGAKVQVLEQLKLQDHKRAVQDVLARAGASAEADLGS